MTTMRCDALRPNLGAFVDGELPGAEMLRVSQHLQDCPMCSAEVELLSDLGDQLREAARLDPAPILSEGLASGVIARTGAEAAQSWRAMLARAVDDWRWAAVGAGSVAATFVSVVIVGAVLWFGPSPGRADSLAALMSNLQGSPGTLWIEGRRSGLDARPEMMLVDSGARSSGGGGAVVLPASLRLGGESEADLVLALLDVVDRGGRLVNLQSMPESQRRYAEGLLDQISEIRSRAMMQGSTGHLMVYRVRLFASTGVSAKVLHP